MNTAFFIIIVFIFSQNNILMTYFDENPTMFAQSNLKGWWKYEFTVVWLVLSRTVALEFAVEYIVEQLTVLYYQ